MGTFISWIAAALACVFFAACVVAWWEHLGRARRRPEELDWGTWESPPPKAVHIDVELDLDPTASAEPGDQAQRQAALGNALVRMAASGTAARWDDTAPMILPGSTDRRQPQDTAQPQ